MPDVAIIGGGITGLATACELMRRGASVTLLEARRLGAMASTWTLGGVRQSGRDPAELPLAKAAVARWQGLDAELDAPTGYCRKGNLRLARNAEEAEAIRHMVQQQRALGLDLSFLSDRQDILAIAPALGQAVVAASFCPDDGHADPDQTIAAYARAARRRGADIREGVAAKWLITRGERIIGVETGDGAILADRVVVATGPHAPELLAPLGIDLPIAAKRVLVLQTVPAKPDFEQVFGVANADCAGRQERGGRYRVTTGITGWSGHIDKWTEAGLRPSLADVAGLIARVTPILPVLAKLGLERVWGGLIDLTPDALPVLDAPVDHPGLLIGAGFSGHGFGIGPVTGEILASLALGEDCAFDLAPFRLARLKGVSGVAALTLHG